MSSQLPGFLLVALNVSIALLPVDDLRRSRFYSPLRALAIGGVLWAAYHIAEWWKNRKELGQTLETSPPAPPEVRAQLLRRARMDANSFLNSPLSLYSVAPIKLRHPTARARSIAIQAH